jgi:hypothetical protein
MALLGTGTSGTVLTVLYFLYKAVLGKRCKSRCCGRELDAGFQVEDMTPPQHNTDRFDTTHMHENPIKVTVTA